MPQDQFLRQDVVAQGDVQLGDDTGDTTTVFGALVLGNKTVASVPVTSYGPGPLTDQEIYSFVTTGTGAKTGAVITISVADDANSDYFMANYNVAHDGTTAVLSSAYGVADVWGGTDPTFSAVYSSGTGPNGADEVLIRMSLADAVTVDVDVDAKLYAV